MSQSNPIKSKITRRSLPTGAATVAVTGTTAASLGFSLTGPASATAKPGLFTPSNQGGNSLCVAHHRELSQHLTKILNSSYVDARMKNKIMSTTTCPHCRVGIAPTSEVLAA